MKEFSGKVALVTGTTGIGRAIALRLAAGGAQVVACGIEPAGNQALAGDSEEQGLTVLVESGDVTELEAMRSIVAKTVTRFGGIDIIVNAAAIHPFGTVVETDLADLESLHDGECGQHLCAGASGHSGDEKARRGIDY